MLTQDQQFDEKLVTGTTSPPLLCREFSATKQSAVTLFHNQVRSKTGFTLVELLSVMVVVAILAAATAPMLTAFQGNTVSQGVYTLSDVIGRSRAYAMSMNTYVYVGFASDNSSFSVPGSTVIGIAASSYGTQIFPACPTAYKPVSKLLRISNVKITSLLTSDLTSGDPRPLVQNSCKVADPVFNQGSPAYSINFGGYAFSSILQIDPQGTVSKIGGDAVPLFEIGLRPVNGNQSNFAAIQICGLTGLVRIYRP